MDLVIRVIEGPDKGQVFPVAPGSHVLGRGAKASFKLTPESVSWEHAVITRDGEDYFVENLSAVGTWVGDAKVTSRVRLRPRDRIRLSGDSVVRLESVEWGGLLASRGFLGALLAAVVTLSVAALFFSGEFEGSPAGNDDWENARRALTPWLSKQIEKGRVPRESLDLFDRAWRLEQTQDYENSSKLWMRLQIVLATAEPSLRSLALAGADANDRSLSRLLRPDPAAPATQPTDDQLAAAMAQFVNRRLTFAAKKAKGGILK